MHYIRSYIAIATIALFAGAATAASPKMITSQAEATIINNEGTEIGTADFKQGPRGIVIMISVRDLPPGKHGMHFHKVGKCIPLETFKGASGHIMPAMLPHGFYNTEGPHAGNLPNLIVSEDGTAKVELYTNLLMLTEGEGRILDEDGSALIIHTNEDNHFTQPIGGSGNRIACGVIEEK